MPDKFDYFVIFAEMRTGSNFLEVNLNAAEGIQCLGEAFNPSFIGYPNYHDLLGIDYNTRENNPFPLLSKIKNIKGSLGGFRYFHDHEPRILSDIIQDHRCAKVILTRNPLDSYVSWKIARETGQWKLTNIKKRRDGVAHFVPEEFESFISKIQNFQTSLLQKLQDTGQTAFFIDYENLMRVETINGLLTYLGSDAKLESVNTTIKPQNPKSFDHKVSNAKQAAQSLLDWDRFDLGRIPQFEPKRAPNIPSYIIGKNAPLMFMPIAGGPIEEVKNWMSDIDGIPSDDLPSGQSQKKIRQWKRANSAHRSFTVVSHPVIRIYRNFYEIITRTAERDFKRLRTVLKKQFNASLPDGEDDPSLSVDMYRDAFAAFVEFAGATLAGQTGFRVDPLWATQSSIIQGFSEFASPDFIIREEELNSVIPVVAQNVGIRNCGEVESYHSRLPYELKDIYTPHLEELIYECYQRDYVILGYSRYH